MAELIVKISTKYLINPLSLSQEKNRIMKTTKIKAPWNLVNHVLIYGSSYRLGDEGGLCVCISIATKLNKLTFNNLFLFYDKSS